MDAGAIKDFFNAVPVQTARGEAAVPRDAVATELPADLAVNSSAKSDGVRKEVSPHAALLSQVSEQMQQLAQNTYERDRTTETLVFKRIAPGTGEVLLQLPSQSILNLRAYLKSSAEKHSATVKKNA